MILGVPAKNWPESKGFSGMQQQSILQRLTITFTVLVLEYEGVENKSLPSFAFPLASPRPLLREGPRFEMVPNSACHCALDGLVGPWTMRPLAGRNMRGRDCALLCDT